ncbi:MAG: LytR family transcriptional regulator [Cellulosilyticum sp.]|nr:LytR family transcriptional regulator [Cellulosilyticum sp.]
MEAKSEEMGKKKASKLRYLFLRSALITLGCISVLCIGAMIIGKNLVESVQVETEYVEYTPKASHHLEKEFSAESEQEVMECIEPTRTLEDKTIMIFGVDKEEARTDTILLAHFDGKTEQIDIMSIPRDTKVFWSETQQDKAVELGRSYQYYSKITDMSSLGGIDHLRYFTIRSVEEMLDIKVDHYAVVNTKVIRELVDRLGGIEVNVPRFMQYDDYYQDLHIDLKPGMQILNGEQAEGLLRWRHNNDFTQQYAEGDLGRIETQQLFIEAFADKLINEVSVGTVIDVLTAIYMNIKTDVSFSEVLEYIQYLPYLSMNNIELTTLPGQSQLEEVWYYIMDEEEAKRYVDRVFYGII